MNIHVDEKIGLLSRDGGRWEDAAARGWAAIRTGCGIALDLGKGRVSALASLSAAAGYVLAGGGLSLRLLIPLLGIFILSSGAAALNQYLERDRDSLMERTRMRPLPARRMSPRGAAIASFAALAAGTAVLLLGISAPAAGLGAFAAAWYDGVYTYLKKKTPYAAIPGSIIGAIPPVIGWIAGGGTLSDPEVRAIALFFVLWQVPHFWLLLLAYGGDYERAGFPTLSGVLSPGQLRRIAFVWIAAVSGAGIALSLCLSARSPATLPVLVALGAWLVWRSAPLIGPTGPEAASRPAFRGINLYVLLALFVLTLDRLVFPR